MALSGGGVVQVLILYFAAHYIETPLEQGNMICLPLLNSI